jgi:hypothetical protein
MTYAANGSGVSVPAAVAYQASIEPANTPANVLIKNRKPIAVRDNEVIEAIKENTAVLKEWGQQPIPVYRVPHPNPVTQEDIDEILDRYDVDVADKRWKLQSEYAELIGCEVGTLRAGREKKNGVVFSSKNSNLGMDKAGNIFLKRGNNETLYFLRDSILRTSHARNGK